MTGTTVSSLTSYMSVALVSKQLWLTVTGLKQDDSRPQEGRECIGGAELHKTWIHSGQDMQPGSRNLSIHRTRRQPCRPLSNPE